MTFVRKQKRKSHICSSESDSQRRACVVGTMNVHDCRNVSQCQKARFVTCCVEPGALQWLQHTAWLISLYVLTLTVFARSMCSHLCVSGNSCKSTFIASTYVEEHVYSDCTMHAALLRLYQPAASSLIIQLDSSCLQHCSHLCIYQAIHASRHS